MGRSREASLRGWHFTQDPNGSFNLIPDVWITTLRFTLEIFYVSIHLQTAVALITWQAYVCKCVLGCGPGSVIHVYEHSWNLHQLPVRPGPAPSLPGDAEVCGGQATPGDGKPKTGTNWKGLLSELHGAFLLPKHILTSSVFFKFCVMDSRV